MSDFEENDIDRQAAAYDEMNRFDQKHGAADSSDEDQMREYGTMHKPTSEQELLKQKNVLLMERLLKAQVDFFRVIIFSERQNTELKETFDSISTNQENLKDKKIIDLAKKNRNLQMQVEALKTKAAKAAEIAIKLSQEKLILQEKNAEQEPLQLAKVHSSPAKQTLQTTLPPLPADSQKQIREMEKKITKLRNENQFLTTQLDKATRLLEREIGEVVDIDSLTKEESQWKSRAQKIEVLKAQLKQAKQAGGQQDNMSVMSEFQAPSMMSKAEKNLTQMQSKKTNEMEQIKVELAMKDDELNQLKKKLSASNARRDTLDVQSKELKQTFQSKIQILIEKTENDDKLIAMLKHEIQRLEQIKSVKSTLNSGKQITQETPSDELIKLRGENGRLKNQVKCSEIEIQQKKEKIEKLLLNGLSDGEDPRIPQLQQQLALMDDQLRQLMRENQRLQQGVMPTKTGRDETERMLKDITQQNAQLRRKLDDAIVKISTLEKK